MIRTTSAGSFAASAGETIGMWDAGAIFPCLKGAESMMQLTLSPRPATAQSVNPWWDAPQTATRFPAASASAIIFRTSPASWSLRLISPLTSGRFFFLTITEMVSRLMRSFFRTSNPHRAIRDVRVSSVK